MQVKEEDTQEQKKKKKKKSENSSKKGTLIPDLIEKISSGALIQQQQ